ncbi:L,D-transpeptidase family protein [Haloferula sp.]|uniref:L,D-transpeptidase family protein n=1 Tax=Haloferula sp. TaxID=2497595 RepID=UPI003C74CF31
MFRRRFLSSFVALGLLPASLASAYIPDNWEAEYEWDPEKSTSGPVLIVVDLDDQQALVFRNGVEIGKTPVSTGKPGHRTPTGIFQILNKDADHHSSTYNNASMPFSERLTWSGIALHAGGLPGYPSSHGCVHLPYSFAKKLFEVTHKGTTVVITQKGHPPHQGTEPAAALLGLEEKAIEDGELDELDDSVMWKPELSRLGSVTMFISGKHEKVEIFRGGVLIGSAPLKLNDPSIELPTAVMLMLEDKVESAPEKDGKKTASSAVLVNPEPPATHWATLSTSGKKDASNLAAKIKANLVMPLGFAQRIHQLAGPGMLVVTTPEEMTVDTRIDEDFHVVSAGKPKAPDASKQ